MDNNLDINLIIQTFQEKISQLMVELVVKEATIKQLTEQLRQMKKPSWQSPLVEKNDEDDVEYHTPEQRQQKPRKGMI